MTTHLDITIRHTILTLHGSLWSDTALGEHHQCLRRLKRRTRSLRFPDGLTDITTLRGVRRQTEYLAIGRIDGYNGPRLTFQQTFAQLLQQRSQRQWSVRRQVLCVQ